jgi:F-type H+-transporting ATPase subunit a
MSGKITRIALWVLFFSFIAVGTAAAQTISLNVQDQPTGSATARIFNIFLFVAFGNVLGLFPYAFTFTSHLAAVGGLSVIALLFNIGIGIKKKKLGWLRTFMPKGIPFALAPLIIPIEMISFLSKPFSLTVRLVANMTVGHIMLKIIAGFVVTLGFLGIVPLAFDACIIVFEIFIALLQAFIYTVLSCIYLGDALHSH